MMLKEIFCANLQLKLLSLCFATILWLLVTLEVVDEVEVPLAVTFVNSPPGLTLRREPSAPLSLRIAGPRTLLLRQKWQGATVELDLSQAQTGRVKFSELDKHVSLVPGVRPVRVSPATLEIFLAKD